MNLGWKTTKCLSFYNQTPPQVWMTFSKLKVGYTAGFESRLPFNIFSTLGTYCLIAYICAFLWVVCQTTFAALLSCNAFLLWWLVKKSPHFCALHAELNFVCGLSEQCQFLGFKSTWHSDSIDNISDCFSNFRIKWELNWVINSTFS